MTANNNSHGELFSVLSRLKARKERLQQEFSGRLAEIDAEIEAVTTTLRLLNQPDDSAATAQKSVWMPASSLAGKTLRAALGEIARHNGGELKVPVARKILLEIGRIKKTRSSWAMLYTTLSRSPEFDKIGPGKYRLSDGGTLLSEPNPKSLPEKTS